MFCAVAAYQIELLNPPSDRPGTMMVLAVNVIGYSPTKRDKLCTGSYRQEISGWNRDLQNFQQANSGFGDKKSGRSIEADKIVKTCHIDHRAIVVYAAISV